MLQVLVGDAEAGQRARRRGDALQHGHVNTSAAGGADSIAPPVVADRRRHSSPGGRRGSSAGRSSTAATAAAAPAPYYPSIPATARLATSLPSKAAGRPGSAAPAAAYMTIGNGQAVMGAEHAVAPLQRSDQTAVGINACPVADTCCNTAVDPVPRQWQGTELAAGTIDVTGCLHVDVLDGPGHAMGAATMGPAGSSVTAMAAPQPGTKFVRID